MRVLIVPPIGDNIREMDMDFPVALATECLWEDYNSDTPAELREKDMRVLTDAYALKKGSAYNQNLYPFFYAGIAVIVGENGGEFTSLTYNQIKHAKEWLARLRLLF